MSYQYTPYNCNMKKPHLYLILILAALCLLLKPQKAIANRAAAGELFYEWISDSTYRFFFTYYNDCSGSAEPNTMPLCFYNTCISSGFSTTMTKAFSVGTSPSFGCSQYKSKCDSPASTIPGIKKWTYTVIVTMPTRCSAWKVYTYTGPRNASLNLQNPTSSAFCAELMMNNTAGMHGNSSPYSTLPQWHYICINTPFTYTVGSVDPNGDSVAAEVIHCKTGVSSCSDTPVNMAFASTVPAYSLSTNPIQCGNTFSVNASTTQMSFTPTELGTFTMTIKIKEYRNNVLVGWTTRDIQFNVLPCTTPTSSLTVNLGSLSGCTYSAGKIYMCSGMPLSFCYDIKSSDTNALYKVVDNSAFSMPGAVVTYSAQPADSIRGCLTWTPGINDTGNRMLVVTVKDSTCGSPWQVTLTPHVVPIYLYPPTRVSNDTGICLNSSVNLKVTGAGNYTWSVLSGTPGSLSCITCANPVATPLVTSKYIATSANNPCGNNKDTITVTILPLTYPSISITVSPGTIVQQFTPVSFIPTVTNCSSPFYRWYRNGNPFAVIDTLVVNNLSDNDIISCKLTCNDVCATPVDTMSNTITMSVVSVEAINRSTGISIYPNPNNGQFVIQASSKISSSDNAVLSLFNLQGQQVAQYNIVKERTDIRLPHSINTGIYIGRFTAGDKETAVLKIICNK